MKKLLAIALVLSIILSLAACGKKEAAPAPVESIQTGIQATATPAPTPEATAAPKYDVELVIPADFIGEVTQEELDAMAEASGYHSITLNDDGSATYRITKEQHEYMLLGVRSSIAESLEDIKNSEDYNFTDIKVNANCTDFKVTTTSEELSFAESLSVLVFYAFGGMYRVFSGEEIDNVHIAFVNEETGEIISEANSIEAAY